MRVLETTLPGVKILEPQVFKDDRGEFLEVWHRDKFRDLGLDVDFAQDNHSVSGRHVLRGLHYQVVRPQGKLVRCVVGDIFDVAVDLRKRSPTFAKWVGVRLSRSNARQLWVPPGFGHGFLTLSPEAHVSYKCSEVYVQEHDRSLAWDDPSLNVEWPLNGTRPILSPKDASAPTLDAAELF